jgi:release factor glutamine methyltransferase
MNKDKTWTLMEIMTWSTDYLSAKGVEDPKVTVEWLLCETLSCNRMDLYLQYDRPLSDSELAVFKPMLLNCAAHQPVQQVVGSCEFYGLTLAVNNKVLVPRPETERLVETCIDRAAVLTGQKMEIFHCVHQNTATGKEDREEKDTGPGKQPFTPKPTLKILDIGAGSGCISIALAMHIPNAEIFALEKSADALEVLKRNIHFYNLDNRVHVIHEDILQYRPEGRFDIIVSNPPYIASGEIPALATNVTHYEPYMALSDAGDGLGFFRHFAQHFTEWLQPGGIALLEFGGNAQTTALKELFSGFETRIIKDYQNDDRVLLLTRKKGKKES